MTERDESAEETEAGGDSGPVVPGAGAGDAARTQQIPRLSKPVRPSTKKATNGAAPEPTSEADETSEPEKPEKPASGVPAWKAQLGDKPKTDETVEKKPEPEPEKKPEPEAKKKPEPEAKQEKEPEAAPKPAPRVAKPGPRTVKVPERERPASTGKPLTAADYAKTTTGSPSATAVIPAVKDDPAPAASPATQVASAATGGGRQARLRLAHIEPWSVTRLSFAVSVAMMIVSVVAVGIFWIVMEMTGVWGQVNEAVSSVLSDGSSTFDITEYLGFWRLVGLTLVISAINVVLLTAFATIAARIYNLAAQLLGGVDVTFADD